MSFKKEEIYKKRICKIELYPCPETLVAVGGGAKHPINTSFRLVDLFTIFYFPLLRERVRVRGLFVYTSGGIL